MFSVIELRRYDLLDAFEDDPDAALARLHELALEQGLPPEALFALAELSFLRARAGARSRALRRVGALRVGVPLSRGAARRRSMRSTRAAALRPISTTARSPRPSSASRAGAVVMRQGGLVRCPSGTSRRSPACLRDLGGYTRSSVSIPWPSSRWWASAIATAGPASARRSRRRSCPRRRAQRSRFRSRDTSVPLTAIAAHRGAARADPLAAGRRARSISARRLECDTSRSAAARSPLEAEPTAALAYGLSESPLLAAGAPGLPRRPARRERSRWASPAFARTDAAASPWCFVHGTASSPGRWADMVNDLVADPRAPRSLRSSGSSATTPATPSPTRPCSCATRSTQAVARCDPEGADRCPARHGRDRPQPGRAAHQAHRHRLAAIASGAAISDKPLDELEDARTRPDAAPDVRSS